MIRNQTSGLKLLTSIALLLVLSLSIALPAFAYSTGTDASHPAQAAITKVFTMPVGTTTPAATFTFTFTPIGIDGETNSAGMPSISPKTASFTAGEAATFVDGGVKSVAKETADILSGLTSVSWPSPGVYTYMVQETASGITIGDPAKEGEVYSTAMYEIEIWVGEDDEGNLFAKYVNAKTVDGYIDEYYDGTPGGEKVDPTPGGVNQVPGTTIEDDFSQVIFTNKYWKTAGGGEEDPNMTALEIIKKVTGNGADLGQYFTFNVKVTQPSIITTGTQTYKACVLDANGNIVTASENYAGTISNGCFVFTSGMPLTVNLKDGQRLAFVDLHVGSVVEAEEAAADGYTPKYQRTFAGTSVYTATGANMAWGFPRASEDNGPHYAEDGANHNIATFTNTRAGATPTGIAVDDLPYVALIAVGLIALIGYVVVKSRRRNATDNA